MKHAVLVGEREGVPYGRDQVGTLVARERATLDTREELREREAVDELHDEVGVVFVGLEVIHGHDVGVRYLR